MSIAKPVLRNLNTSQLKKQLALLVGITGSITLAYKVLVVDARRKSYENFYKTYDANAHLQGMIDAGLLESAQE